MSKEIARALIIKRKWLDKIFDNGKCWEMRSRPTNITGKIGLIESGSGLIVGEAVLAGCYRPSSIVNVECRNLHQVDDLGFLEKWCYAWVLEDVKRYDKPVEYNHPHGAVIWVKI